MNPKILVKVIQASDAILSRPVPAITRCNNCAYEGKCDVMAGEKNKVRGFYKRVVENDCNGFKPVLIVVNNDGNELDNLRRYAMHPVMYHRGRPAPRF
jgi:hypothetical protein